MIDHMNAVQRQRARTVLSTLARIVAGLCCGFACGVVVIGAAFSLGTKALALLASVAVSVALIALFGAERVLIGAILIDLPLQVDFYIGWREAEAELSALAGLPVSLTTLALCGLVVWRIVTRRRLLPLSSFAHRASQATLWSFVAYVGLASLSVAPAVDVPFSMNLLVLLLQCLVLYVYLTASLSREKKIIHWTVEIMLLGLILEGLIIMMQVATGGVARASGMLGSPNSAATYLSVMVLLALAGAVDSDRGRQRSIAMMALVVGVSGLALTQSRGGLVAVCVGIVVFVVLGLRIGRLTARPIMAIGGMIVIVAAVAGKAILERIADDGGAAQGRVPLIEIAVDMIKSAPVSGVGLNNFVIVLPDFVGPQFAREWLSIVHNHYLLVGSESGLVGLLAFVLFLGFALKLSWEGAKIAERKLSLIALALCGALAGRAVHMFLDVFKGPLQWHTLIVMVAVATAIYEISATSEPARDAVRTGAAGTFGGQRVSEGVSEARVTRPSDGREGSASRNHPHLGV